MWQRIAQSFSRTETGTNTGDSGDFLPRQAAILHVDVVGSTQRVRSNPALAHRQIEQLYARLCFLGDMHNAIPRELRGDAAVIEFASVACAVRAAQALHAAHAAMSHSRLGLENPRIRTGISFGEIIGDKMITGEAVIRAQRLEQLSEPGEVLIDQPAADRLTQTDGFELSHRDTRVLKGFDESVSIYCVEPESGPGVAFSRVPRDQ